MKPALLVAITAVFLLLGALVYWNTRVEPPSFAGSRAAPTPATPSGAPEVRLEAAKPDPEAPMARPEPDARKAAAPAVPAPVQPSADDPPPITDMGDASAASVDAARAPESAEFAKKYRTVAAAERKKARLAIEDTLLAHKQGTIDKSVSLSGEDLEILTREAQWLDAHPSP